MPTPKPICIQLLTTATRIRKWNINVKKKTNLSQVKCTNISMSCCYLQQLTRKTHQILVACVGKGTGLYVRPKCNTTEKFYDITSIKFLTQDHLQKQLEHHNCSSAQSTPEGILNIVWT
jgi:hypothetical protein